MPVAYYNQKPTLTDVPRHSAITISALPGRRTVIKTVASGSFTPADLDPGKYVYTICQHNYQGNPHRVKQEKGEFLVDVTEEQFARLVHIKPRLAKGLMTTDGARWSCGFVGCEEKFSSPIAAVQHEGEHFGVDLIHETDDKKIDAAMHSASRAAEATATKIDVRPRPRE